mmetsp:Transcript_29598/g.98065  ORF Transcript_29598/g.98065 Transcript_29598/m.98065 type:complete len:232 (+) Transcript_29598:263-958(+)
MATSMSAKLLMTIARKLFGKCTACVESGVANIPYAEAIGPLILRYSNLNITPVSQSRGLNRSIWNVMRQRSNQRCKAAQDMRGTPLSQRLLSRQSCPMMHSVKHQQLQVSPAAPVEGGVVLVRSIGIRILFWRRAPSQTLWRAVPVASVFCAGLLFAVAGEAPASTSRACGCTLASARSIGTRTWLCRRAPCKSCGGRSRWFLLLALACSSLSPAKRLDRNIRILCQLPRE